MKKGESQSSFVNIGSSFLLVIFLVLALVTFAVLSLSSARSDYTMSERLAEHKSEYYEASSTGEIILSYIDKELEALAKTSADDLSGYKKAVVNKLDETEAEGTVLSCQETEGEIFISYQVSLSDKQALNVRLLVTDYTQSEAYYEIKAWQVISTGTWEGDQSIQLLPMGE